MEVRSLRVVLEGSPDHDQVLAHDLGEQLTVGAAAECRVQVDQVNPFGAVALPAQRSVQR